MLFRKQDDSGRADGVKRVKIWLAAHAAVNESDAVMVTEVQCSEDGCPPIETILALLRPGRDARKWKIHKRVADVTEDDVRDAIHGHDDAHG